MMTNAQELKRAAYEMRIDIIRMLAEAGNGHPGGSLSAIDVIAAVWLHAMRGARPGEMAPDRDRFVLSKGHGVPALYAVLARLGFLPKEELLTLRKLGSRLQGHPDRVRLPVLEASTGSLGQGLSVAQGLAIGLRLNGTGARVYCLMGDGECQEGQVWEAAMSAPKFGLGNLCAIIDHNNGQIDGHVSAVMPIEPIAEKFRAFGWKTAVVDGHDLGALTNALDEFASGAGSKVPTLLVAETVKGKGVSFMENKIDWHGIAPNREQEAKAIQELETALSAMGGRSA